MDDEPLIQVNDEEEEEEDTPPADDKTPEDKKNEEGEDDKDKKPKYDRSEVAQKAKWRERARTAEARLKELEGKSSDKPVDDKEAAAQKYIREQARAEIADIKRQEKEEEERIVAEFEAAVDEILEENPDITEKQLLDVIEDYEVEPAAALRIIRRQEKSGTDKPNLPKPKRASTTPPKKEVDDKGKSMWQIAQEVAKEYAQK